MLIDNIGKYTIQIIDINTELSQQDSSVLVQGSYKTNYIPSVNTQYIIHDGTKTLDPAIKQDRMNIINHLAMSGYDRDCIPEDYKLSIDFGFYVNHSINNRDLDNMIKANLDTIAEYFKFNDNRVYNLTCYKRLLLYSEKELVHFRIKKCILDTKNINIDYRLISSDGEKNEI